MGNLSSKNSKVKGKTATELLPQIVWANIVGRLAIDDVFKSIRFVSKELKAAGEAVLKDKDRLVITVSGNTVIQCFDSSHFINKKDFLTLSDRFVSISMKKMDCLERMMPSLEILGFSNCISDSRNLALVMMSLCKKSFPNLVCLVCPNGCLWYYPNQSFPKIEHLVIQSGGHFDNIVPSLQSLNIHDDAVYRIDKIPDSCKRLIIRISSWPNAISVMQYDRLPSSLEVLDVQRISFEGYQRQWRPSFRRLKDISISHGIESNESFIDFTRDHKRTLETFKVTLNWLASLSDENLKQVLSEVSDMKKFVIKIRRPHRYQTFKVVSTLLKGEAKNLFFEIL